MFANTHAYFSIQENRSCSVNYLCLGSMLTFFGCILFCTLGFIVILPFVSTHHWREESCVVLSSAINSSVCACADEHSNLPGCEEYYPCLQVYVRLLTDHIKHNTSGNYENSDNKAVKTIRRRNNARNHTGHNKHTDTTQCKTQSLPQQTSLKGSRLIHSPRKAAKNQLSARELRDDQLVLSTARHKATGSTQHSNSASRHSNGDDEQVAAQSAMLTQSTDVTSHGDVRADRKLLLFRSWADTYYDHCTLQECGDKDWNAQSNQIFSSQFATTGQQLTCFRDPLNPRVVILQRTSVWRMVQAVVWPSLCLLIGVTLWVGVCFGCCKEAEVNGNHDHSYYSS